MIANIIDLSFTILIYTIGIIHLFKYYKKLDTKLSNIIFSFIIFIPYIVLLYFAYKMSKQYNINAFVYSLPISNISPLMFTLTIVALIDIKILKKSIYNLYAYLIIGMGLAALLSDIGSLVQGIPYNIYRTMDSISHVSMSLFGIYLVLSNQIEINKKSFIKAVITIYSIVLTIIIINLIFDTSFFGLSLRGKHNIYQLVLTSNSFISLLIYITGLFGVLIVSYFIQKLIIKKIKYE